MLANITAANIDGPTFLLNTGSTIIRPMDTTIMISALVIWLTDVLPVIFNAIIPVKIKIMLSKIIFIIAQPFNGEYY